MVNSASCKHGRDGGVGKFLLCFGLTFLIDVEYQGTHITLTVGMGPCTRMALLVRYAPKTDRVVAVWCQLEEERESSQGKAFEREFECDSSRSQTEPPDWLIQLIANTPLSGTPYPQSLPFNIYNGPQ